MNSMFSKVEWSGFNVKVGEATIVVPCIEVVLFLDITDDVGILDFYQRARTALGNRITHYQAESMNGYSRLNARGESLVATWFTKPKQGKLNYYMRLCDGDPDESVTASTIELSVFRRPTEEITPEIRERWRMTYGEKKRNVPHPGTLLRMTLPVEHPLAEPGELRNWILDSYPLKGGTVFTGHSGYALNHYMQAAHPNLYGPTKAGLASLVLRHPGLGWQGGGLQSRVLRYELQLNDFIPLIKRANWLNLVCDKTLDRIGGRPHSRAAFADDLSILVDDVEHGLVIQAGPAPEVGDLGHRDFIAGYRRVARVLRPVRIPDLAGLGSGFMQAATNEWLNAFDKDYT